MPRGSAKRARDGKPARLSLRAFGRSLRPPVSHTAVQKAIRNGRLRKSVARDARGPFIADAALAGREWASGASKPANNGHRTRHPAIALAPVGGGAYTLVDAQLRLTGERAAALELANRRKRGEVVEAATVEREQFGVARMVRERILNVPDRLPELGADLRARLIAELRQALAVMADELERE